MTVYKPIRKLANTAAEVAMTLATGKHVKGNEMITAGTVSVKAILLEPIIVDNFNYKETVVKDGHVSLSEVVKNLGKAFEAERNRIQLALLLKEKALEVEQKKNQRQIFLVVLVFLGLMLAALSFTIYQKHRNNRLLNIQKQVIEKKNEELQKINAQLQVLNEELRGQKEQISHQRDAITRQKEELISVNEIIAAQKDAIQYQNESLEKEVHKRTTVKMHQDRPEEARFMIGKLVESSQELDLVFRELNSILDIRTFSMEIFSQVNLEEELSNIKGNLQTEIQQNEAIIQNNFDSVATLFSIKPYIHSILFNLISNAIKYRDPARPPVIRIHTEKLTDNRVLLSVADNGLGIDMLYVDKVFQLYKRFHFHVEGRGIGLFLVKTQVDSLGGKIEIESEVNKGTTINIYLQQSHTNGKH
jgi:signal transduction histidine kinase